ncbi:M14 family metallocarboxypeptidase [Vibrio sp. CAU 1672]|uniref:M14 family metallopeptidase n=1 Tax=Vibrio sp. CAU 1672 TaxID=3032594 RepID=UPI0023DB7613|nr:M14 family metallocarboxypeptidase [Vibrio sp. CAU 1672]MDF2155162.1 M14 family metallocarboxypeptidase [Vibrio sp. CAU 1672]
MKNKSTYPIGTPGQKWGAAERQAWLARQTVQRSYHQQVIAKIDALRGRFDVHQYGALSYDETRFPLFCIKTRQWDNNKPVVLITGGVHGYETSGVQGALKFLDTQADRYTRHFNIVVVPCVSPWGYEVINRWNPDSLDPNRSFYPDSPAEEAAQLIKLVATLGDIRVHFDLHETTDSDESEFRPALAARDGQQYIEGMIPDGFYTVGDSENPQPEFQKAVIESVAKVTHIAPADENGEIIGSPVVQPGVINYPMKQLGLCGSVTNCQYGTTTEVYPDSPRVTDEECNLAQVAAIVGGLDYVICSLHDKTT